ncbi:hypothetical protein MC885_003922 [Smutsia gigantea]|nr:hypothetical protein MC885_003922 [Smutsia gigantea]
MSLYVKTAPAAAAAAKEKEEEEEEEKEKEEIETKARYVRETNAVRRGRPALWPRVIPFPCNFFLFIGPRSPSPKSLRRTQRKSGSDLSGTLPEIWAKAPHAAPVRKPIVLKKIVTHTVEIAFFLEKENNPPGKEPTGEDLFQTCSIPVIPTPTPVLGTLNVESNSREGDLDARDVEMSKKVRRSYSRLETLGSTSTSTPGCRSCFGSEGLLGAEDLAAVSPVVCSKLTEAPKVPEKIWAPDTTLPGISPPVVKEKRKKKKVPEILKSELDEWAAAMNAEFEAAEQFDLLVE